MKFELPILPYANDKLVPHISAETIDFHYGKHHQTYVNNLNNLIVGTEFENASLEEIIKKANGGILNNAAQVFNHTFFWNCLSPNGGGEPTGKFAAKINECNAKTGCTFQSFKDDFSNAAISLFGSGWVWLCQNTDGNLEIKSMANAGNPLTEFLNPVLCIDVWEHAYYIDYRNARAKFVEAFWNLVNWDFVNSNLK